MYISVETINGMAKLLCSMVVIGGETTTITGISSATLSSANKEDIAAILTVDH